MHDLIELNNFSAGMGNYRFKLSDLIPNSWLHKLRQMSKTRNRKLHSTSPSSSSEPKRKSYYLTKTTSSSHQEPPRKSSRRRRRRRRRSTKRRFVSSAGCSCRATLESVNSSNTLLSTSTPTNSTSIMTEYGSDRGLTTPDDTFDGMEITNGNDERPPSGFDIVSPKDHHRLPPIITSKQEPTKGSMSVKVVMKEDILTCNTYKDRPIRRYSPNSPRISRKSVSSNSSSEISTTFAVMKFSKDPGRDFRESMVEMIVVNNIRASTDLENLLACYLSLNSTEYHHLIINVFKQIWFDFLHK
ncbi:transcription repressor OFP1 [Henckelia pumila]|uniref:transcription repressor OFP1 n=1 Tax=Henckelia pumila TaxID=405737 RepID=UPI003C6E090D